MKLLFALLVAIGVSSTACVHLPARGPSLAPPPGELEKVEALRPRGPAAIVDWEPVDSGLDLRQVRFRLAAEGQSPENLSPENPSPGGSVGSGVTGELYLGPEASAGKPAPLLQIAPILGGAIDDYLLSRLFARWAVEAGFAAFFLHQDEIILQGALSGRDLTGLLVRTTRVNIQAIEALANRPEIDSTRLGCFGVSLGAIKNVFLLAAEPRLAGGILCLSGGDLPRIFRLSREGMIEDYFRERREATGLERAAVLEDLESNLRLDPIDVAPVIGARRALLFLGSLDDKVPYPSGLDLYRALGRPELHVLPLGHYTGIVAVGQVAEKGFRWLKRRFESSGGSLRL